jgi:hypothetical protein
MTNSEINPLSDSLIYEDQLPLSWETRDENSQSVSFIRVAEHNEYVIRCVNLLGDQIREKSDEDSEAESTLIRLEAKVNLILEMLSNLNRDRSDVPQAAQVRLAATGIEWSSQEQPPAEGAKIWVKLYVDSRVPEAMQLAAQVVKVSDVGHGATVYARFEEMGEAVQDQLEKMIFRHHRRMVAQAKSK